MAEKKNLIHIMDSFSKKIARLTDDELDNQSPAVSKNQKLQNEIYTREADRKSFLCRKFQDFLEPRTQDIEQDEDWLIDAYEFYLKLTEIVENAASEKSSTHLRSMELSSPLCRRDDYTLGDDMAFLRLWFLQKNPDASLVPEVTRTENGQFFLIFTDRELWKPSSLEKEILRAIDEADEMTSTDDAATPEN